MSTVYTKSLLYDNHIHHKEYKSILSAESQLGINLLSVFLIMIC